MQGVLRLISVSAPGATMGAPALADRTKAAGEEAVRAAFPQATIIRPSLVFGSGDHFFTRWAAMTLTREPTDLRAFLSAFKPVQSPTAKRA
jgi:uncharacterized protein YbjT (DUF2867 family)